MSWRRLPDEQGLRGVDDIVGGEAVVEPASVRADDFGHGGGEGDDVVATSASISWMRSTRKSARSRMASAASFGTMPASASVSVAATSTASQVRKRFSSLQMRAISGRV